MSSVLYLYYCQLFYIMYMYHFLIITLRSRFSPWNSVCTKMITTNTSFSWSMYFYYWVYMLFSYFIRKSELCIVIVQWWCKISLLSFLYYYYRLFLSSDDWHSFDNNWFSSDCYHSVVVECYCSKEICWDLFQVGLLYV